MSNMDIVLTLVFSIVMLLFMSYPAMVVSNFIEEKLSLSDKWHAPLVILFTILFSLAIGLFLKFG